jgi:hypothetical protein
VIDLNRVRVFIKRICRIGICSSWKFRVFTGLEEAVQVVDGYMQKTSAPEMSARGHGPGVRSNPVHGSGEWSLLVQREDNALVAG